MTGIDEFSQQYLQQWDKRATVRSKPRYRITESDTRQDMFPAGIQPLVKHEAVTALGKDAVRELLVRTAYQWQGAVADVEVEVVAHLCGGLANQNVQFALPGAARQVLLTIGTDEMYHAYAAREYIDQVRRLTGIEPQQARGDAVHSMAAALAYIRRSAPAGLMREAEAMALCFAEHFVTEELFGLVKDGAPQGSFQIITREHLIDEGRHQVFFAKLMAHMWEGLEPACRSALGQLLPGFLDAFLRDAESYATNAAELLGALGFEAAEARKITNEAFDAEFGPVSDRKSQMKHAQHCLSLVHSSGMLRDATTREALIDSGWVET